MCLVYVLLFWLERRWTGNGISDRLAINLELWVQPQDVQRLSESECIFSSGAVFHVHFLSIICLMSYVWLSFFWKILNLLHILLSVWFQDSKLEQKIIKDGINFSRTDSSEEVMVFHFIWDTWYTFLDSWWNNVIILMTILSVTIDLLT